MLSGEPSGSRSVASADDASPASFNNPVFFGGFGGALRLSRWTTSPEGRISLTRKSVYLCRLDRSFVDGCDQEGVPLLQNATKAKQIRTDKLGNAAGSLFAVEMI